MGDYDALMIVSFGGPEGREDVIPFLENVLRGRNVPHERMLAVAEHYYQFGGVSPINAQNRQLIAAIQVELQEHGVDLPIYWGNRNWHPLLADTLQEMKADGVKRALAFFTSTFSSYSGCRQYRENLIDARAQVGEGVPEVDKLRFGFNHPGFVAAMSERVQTALSEIPDERRAASRLVYTAHSIPQAMAAGCEYENQLRESCRLITEQVGQKEFDLVYQSRSGPPSQPWLEPDVCDHLQKLRDAGQATDVVVIPIGFISDHMEVVFDLDTEAKQLSDQIGLNMVRAGTVGTHPRYISMIRELIEERLGSSQERLAVGNLGPCHDVCPPDCCLSGRPASRPSGR